MAIPTPSAGRSSVAHGNNDRASIGQLFGYPFRIFFLSMTVLVLTVLRHRLS